MNVALVHTIKSPREGPYVVAHTKVKVNYVDGSRCSVVRRFCNLGHIDLDSRPRAPRRLVSYPSCNGSRYNIEPPNRTR